MPMKEGTDKAFTRAYVVIILFIQENSIALYPSALTFLAKVLRQVLCGLFVCYLRQS